MRNERAGSVTREEGSLSAGKKEFEVMLVESEVTSKP
jgi:hypothetical protein